MENDNPIVARTQDSNGNFIVGLKDGSALFFDERNLCGTPLTDKDFLLKNTGKNVRHNEYFAPMETGIFTDKTCKFYQKPNCRSCSYGEWRMSSGQYILSMFIGCKYKGKI